MEGAVCSPIDFSTSFESLDVSLISNTLDNITLCSTSSSESTSTPECTPPPPNTPERATPEPRRNLRPRSENLLRLNRRTIEKPKRLAVGGGGSFSAVTEKEIKKLYTNANKMTRKLKPTNLETIFEEPKTAKNNCTMLLSGTRFRRSLQCSNGVASKQVIQNRRKRMKRLLGSAPRLKRISMDTFMEHFKALQEGEGEEKAPTGNEEEGN